MTDTKTINRRIVLASRPIGAPVPEDFRLEEADRPSPVDGQLLLRNLYLSLDPYMRGRMSEGPSYAKPVGLGEVMGGATVSRVETSRHADFQEGDLVVGFGNWQDYAVSDGSGLVKLGDQIPTGFRPERCLVGSMRRWQPLLGGGKTRHQNIARERQGTRIPLPLPISAHRDQAVCEKCPPMSVIRVFETASSAD
jgi:hypothetical protein